MSVVYRNWELGGGPAIGYTIGGPPNAGHCVADGPNLTSRTQQDSLIRGLSALSLCVQSHHNSEHQDASHSFPLDNCPFIHTLPHDLHQEPAFDLDSMGNARALLHNHRLPALDVVSEEKPWDDEDSITIARSPQGAEEAPSTFSQARSEGLEAQLMDDGTVEPLDSVAASTPVKKSLSRFYAGKSRSFTSLSDVTSIKDIAKPENPYARKRKSFSGFSSNNSDKQRFNALRNGAGICKKPAHSNKSNLVLAFSMTTKEGICDGDEYECSCHFGAPSHQQSSSAPPRSYSLSDLQGGG